MSYNSREVNEIKRRLSEHVAELQRTGGPHQQTLRQDIVMLLQAHGLAVERVGVLEQALTGQTANAETLIKNLDEATRAVEAAEIKLAKLGGLGIASTEGKTLTEIRADIAKG